jgi:hypothetical protein
MSEALANNLRRGGRRTLAGGCALAAVCATGGVANGRQFFQSWLVAWLFYAGLSMGALVIMMVQSLTGGAWGTAIKRLCEAAAQLLPLSALLFMPLIFGVEALYPWANRGMGEDAGVSHKRLYLSWPLFAGRGLLFILVLSGMAAGYRWLSIRRDRGGNLAISGQWEARLGAVGLIFYVLGMGFTATDWVMSLEPDWHSTMFAIILMVGQLLAALAAMTAVLAAFSTTEPFATFLNRKHFLDLGNLLLTFTAFWAYVSFSQFLIIWSGNLPKEITWYEHRGAGGWGELAGILVLFQFFMPLVFLLSKSVKERPKRLGAVALLIVVGGLLNTFWLVAPSLHPHGFRVHWLDVATMVAMGGIWAGAFLNLLARRPLLPTQAGEAAIHG